jgi:hypothetical protein
VRLTTGLSGLAVDGNAEGIPAAPSAPLAPPSRTQAAAAVGGVARWYLRRVRVLDDLDLRAAVVVVDAA